LILAAVLFAVGLAGALTRRNAILCVSALSDAQCGQPELHRILALQSDPETSPASCL